MVPRFLGYNSNKNGFSRMQPEFDCARMPEVLFNRERPDCVIHARLETELFLSSCHPIENLLLGMSGFGL
jgi:hypothetical protein